jgi:hypothetical protein
LSASNGVVASAFVSELYPFRCSYISGALVIDPGASE